MHADRLFFGLAGLCALMAAILAWVSLLPPKPIDVSDLSTPRPAAVAGANLASSPNRPGSYDELSARPLFTPSRRAAPPQPVKPPAETAAAPLPMPTLALLGTIIAEGERIAFIKLSSEPHGQALRIDDIVEGWKVIEIRIDSILLESGTRKHVVATKSGAASIPGQPANAPPPSPLLRSNHIRR